MVPATSDHSGSGAAVRALLLDFNGTLAQDDHLIVPLVIDGFALLGVSLTAAEYHRELAGLPDRPLFALALERAGLPFDEARRDELVEARIEGYLTAVEAAHPIDAHALAFVYAAVRRVPLAIVSGASRREIECVLVAAGVQEHFPVVVAIDDVQHGKPDPEGFALALDRLNHTVARGAPIAPGEVVVVEDATSGAYAARAAGMRVAAIRGPAYDSSSGLADLVIDRLDLRALELILGLGGASR